MKANSKKTYGIIGLGRFGMALAIHLAKAGYEILVIDANEDNVRKIREYTQYAFVVKNNLDKETLEATGIADCDVAVVCIGEKIDISILVTLHLVDMGIPRVIAKANNEDHGEILKKIGAEVVYPERDMADRLAARLLSERIENLFALKGDIDIAEINLPDALAGKTVLEAALRKKYNLNILAILRGEEIIVEIKPDEMFCAQDQLVVLGKSENIQKFEEKA